MTKKVAPIPAGYHSLTPYLIVKNADQAIAFYNKAFGAVEIMRSENKGRVCHAELKIGDSIFMLADEFPEMGCVAPVAEGGFSTSLMIYTENVDDVVKNAVDAGAKLTREVQDMFYGDRSGMFTDPFGHKWTVSTHIEDVSDEEINVRMQKFFEKQPS